EADPDNWSLRRELAEKMLESGDREGGVRELEAAMMGAERANELDLASSLAEEIARLAPETVRFHQKRVEYAFRTNDKLRLIEEEPAGDEEADFADMLKKFKQGIAENVAQEDYHSHYDLGVAFKEMGLVDEAVAEFQKALKAPSNRLPTYEALGQCFIEKQQNAIASTVLARALGEGGYSDEELVGILYLLGRAAQSQKHFEEALGYYQRVCVVNIEFRDVIERIK